MDDIERAIQNSLNSHSEENEIRQVMRATNNHRLSKCQIEDNFIHEIQNLSCIEHRQEREISVSPLHQNTETPRNNAARTAEARAHLADMHRQSLRLQKITVTKNELRKNHVARVSGSSNGIPKTALRTPQFERTAQYSDTFSYPDAVSSRDIVNDVDSQHSSMIIPSFLYSHRSLANPPFSHQIQMREISTSNDPEIYEKYMCQGLRKMFKPDIMFHPIKRNGHCLFEAFDKFATVSDLRELVAYSYQTNPESLHNFYSESECKAKIQEIRCLGPDGAMKKTATYASYGAEEDVMALSRICKTNVIVVTFTENMQRLSFQIYYKKKYGDDDTHQVTTCDPIVVRRYMHHDNFIVIGLVNCHWSLFENFGSYRS
ncbi:hypothetical protein T484DRAFT_1757507 [Baffinella frigidus]|nr:hypothetical protein T484DRAFT_1757507 [Cryptophyta sp. CCMP2293]